MNIARLDYEWEHVENLTDIALQRRQSQSPTVEALAALQNVHEKVQIGRAEGVWDDLLPEPYTPYDYDILSCVIAADISPRIAQIYQLLHGQKFTPYPTLHVLQELLGLMPKDMSGLYEAVNENSPLQQRGLISLSSDAPHTVIKPGKKARAKIMGICNLAGAPPGASLITTEKYWDDLILPNGLINQLKDFAALITAKDHIINQWGGQDYAGPIALFCGPSGTGKTMTASVISTELGWPLYRIDIGRLVSKYIGDTERNLSELFAAAHDQKMILQFDEADALFAKRGAVRNASDRYANQQGSHLLSCIESHNGPCILTTNLRQQIDSAFLRRFHCVVDFPNASIAARRELWARQLPPKAPLSGNVNLDLLAAHAPLNGGSIRSAALQASVMAARNLNDSPDRDSALTMEHLCHAVWRELQKQGRAVSLSEIGPLASYLNREGI